ncbi:CLUMA_CG006361, isoform A [Clunio marinus]|uniref:CLUMA_CG006361, isoform A n=1 Tax=Clunio marinus TaxID=568069 RepID=A0A1J1I2X1_9DIPT|nr:CLUMA_CG006361, isoform A [Clunio marinus]
MKRSFKAILSSQTKRKDFFFYFEISEEFSKYFSRASCHHAYKIQKTLDIFAGFKNSKTEAVSGKREGILCLIPLKLFKKKCFYVKKNKHQMKLNLRTNPRPRCIRRFTFLDTIQESIHLLPNVCIVSRCTANASF